MEDLSKITRLEVIGYRDCAACKGKGHLVDKICPECDGRKVNGRDVIFWDVNARVDVDIQDEGRTLKIFVSKRKK